MSLEPLKKANKAIQEAVEKARRRRNEKDRKDIVSAVGKDLKESLAPFLDKLVDRIEGAIAKIQVATPNVKVEQPKITVQVPEVKIPEIKVPKVEVEVKIPPIKVPTPKVTVNVPPQKQPIVNVSPPKVTVKASPINLKGINRDNPLNVILTDQKNKEYKAMGGIIGGGGRGVVTTRKATGSKIEEVSLTAETNWYPYTIPKGTTALDFFLTERGYKAYYAWKRAGDGEARMPLFPGYSRRIPDAEFGGRIIYFTCPTANQTIVVEAFLGG